MSQPVTITATAPGTLMLMGEHAVLYGELAIACAVEQRISVRLEPLSTDQPRQLIIDSALGSYEGPLDSLKDDPALRFVLQAVRARADQLSCGLSLKIESEFSHTVGLGSSAAVTVATVAVLERWLNPQETAPDHQRIFDQSLAAMLAVQGRGSGTDLAASTWGALIGYRVDPREVIPLRTVPEIGLWYCGYKTPTPVVLARVAEEKQRFPELYDQLYRLMGQVTAEAMVAARQADWQRLGQLMNYYQGLMDSLGVNDRKLSDIVYRLREAGVAGAKISGSGLGDCVISLGRPGDVEMAADEIAVRVAPEGVLVSVA